MNNNQMSLFSAPQEKGAAEWSTFRGVRGDRSNMFRVKDPEPQTGANRHTVTVFKKAPRPASLFFKGAR